MHLLLQVLLHHGLIVELLLFLFLIKPLVKELSTPAPVKIPPPLEPLPERPKTKVEELTEWAKKSPSETVSLIRKWLAEKK